MLVFYYQFRAKLILSRAARSLQIFNFDSGRERPSSPPNPKSTLVPYYDDGDFIERGEILQRIEELCSRRAGRAALVGLSGVG